MRCLIVGTDRLGSAPAILKERYGVTEVLHCDGRKKLKISKNLSMIVVYVGFANHTIVNQVKTFAKKYNIRTVFVNRGLSELANVS